MRKEVERLERRILKWLFAPGAWVVTATLLLFSSLVVYYLPMTADEKFGAIRGVVLVLAVLHFFVARCEVLRFLLDFLLSVILFIPLYFLSVILFIAACHVFLGAATDAVWLQFAARIASACYIGACARLLRGNADEDTSALKILWLSWFMTPLSVSRLLDRRTRNILEEIVAKRSDPMG